VSIIAADELPAIDDVTAADESNTADDIAAIDEPAVIDNAIAVSEPAVIDNVTVADVPDAIDDIIAIIEPVVTDNAVAASEPAEAVTEDQPEPRIASGTLTLVPADERVPPAHDQPATASRDTAPHGVASRTAAPETAVSRTVVPTDAAPPVTQPVETPAAYAPSAEFSPFQAPLISSLEQGKWYVQIGVYSRPDNVEDEISRIGATSPVAIQNIGSDTSPMFRVLLGPLNQGESGAMLQRFKSIGYADAFVRHN
jgi:cell division septation protein DedD